MWSFSADLCAERIARLFSYPNFAAVIELVERSASILGFKWEPFDSPRLRGCHRASYLLQVSADAYDAFFNSPVGYRGQYARKVETGLRANRELIDRLKPRLLLYDAAHATVTQTLLSTSLDGVDAKVWIDEDERDVQRHLGDATPEILYKPWIDASPDGAGLRAPRGCQLVVMGGWLDAQGGEQRDPHKANRGRDIHTEGFS